MNAAKTKPRSDYATPSVSLPKDSSNNCMVAKGTKIEGNIRASENVRLDGTVVGEFHCDKKLVMGDQSRLEGKLFANEAVIMGSVVGDISISGTLQLTGSAKIQGNIKAKQLLVEEGAVYNGDCQVGG